jgi:hypothetical protein
VGDGDITPATDGGKLFTVMYIIVGLSVIGGFLAILGRLIDPRRFLSVGSGAPEMAKLREELAGMREELARRPQRAETVEAKEDDQA